MEENYKILTYTALIEWLSPENATHLILKWDDPIHPLNLFEAGRGSSQEPLRGVLAEKQGRMGRGYANEAGDLHYWADPMVCLYNSFSLPPSLTEPSQNP